jgi:hypothetical protein
LQNDDAPARRRSGRDLSSARAHFDNLKGWQDALPSLVLSVPTPRKHNADRRHDIPKMSFKVQNWPA